MSATIISSSTPKQNPCGELNCAFDAPNEPNLHLICMGVAFERPAPFIWPFIVSPISSVSVEDIVPMGDIAAGGGMKSFNMETLSIPGDDPRCINEFPGTISFVYDKVNLSLLLNSVR